MKISKSKSSFFFVLTGILLANSPKVYSEEIRDFKTPDGVYLAGYEQATGKDVKGAVVMFTMENREHSDYFPLMAKLTEAGYYTIAFDLRGQHGSVCRSNGTNIFNSNFKAHDWAFLVNDVKSVVTQATGKLWKKEKPVFLLGSSYSANAVAMAGADLPNVKGMILLSPGLNYEGLMPEQSLRNFKGRVYMIWSMADNYTDKSAQKLASVVAPENLQQLKSVLATSGTRGNFLFRAEPFLNSKILSFIQASR